MRKVTDIETNFSNILYTTRERIYVFVYRLLRNHEDTQDVLQKVYITLWQNMEKLQPGVDPLPLLYTYAKHLSLNEIKSRVRRELHYKEASKNNETASNQTEEAISFRHTEKKLIKAVNQLPPRRKEIYQLVKQEGLSHKEVALRLSLSVSTVEASVNQAIKTLKQELASE